MVAQNMVSIRESIGQSVRFTFLTDRRTPLNDAQHLRLLRNGAEQAPYGNV